MDPEISKGSISVADEGMDRVIREVNAMPKIDDNRGKFLNNKRVMLTYKTHLDKLGLEMFILGVSPGNKVKFFRAAHESADTENPYLHTHAVVEWDRAFQSADCRKLDFLEIHPHIKPIRNDRHFSNAKAYLGKEDPANADLRPKPSIVKSVGACKSSKDALLQYCRRPSDAPGVLAIYNEMNRGNIVLTDRTREFKRWQKDLFMMLERPVCESPVVSENEDSDGTDMNPPTFKVKNRVIHWIYDPVGRSGKTWFCKQCMIHDPINYFATQNMGTSRDAGTIIEGALEGGWSGKNFLLNLTRSNMDHKIYSSIEAIRDGMVTSQKYKGRVNLFNNCNFVVFANWMPAFTEISNDRWRILGIDKAWRFRDIPISEAMEIGKRERENPLEVENLTRYITKREDTHDQEDVPILEGTQIAFAASTPGLPATRFGVVNL